jgi:hypothetical protein
MSDEAGDVWPPADAPYYAHPGDPPAVARLSGTQTEALRALVGRDAHQRCGGPGGRG